MSQPLRIVKLSLEDHEDVKSLADRFGVSANAIYNWRSKYLKHKDAAFPGHGNKTMTDSEREIAVLKKQLRETELERDILKKAVGIFSKSDRKFTSS